MKFGFVTCVQLGLSCMEAIYEVGGKLSLAITLKDNKAKLKSGRVYLDEFCHEHAVPLLKIDHINDEQAIEKIAQLDWLFIIGWSQIAGARVLNAPSNGVLGMHPTLLPVGRGRASIPWAILHQLPETGVTLFKLDEGVDTGPIIAQHVIPLNEFTDATLLYNLVNKAHVELMKNSFPCIVDETLKAEPQNEQKATIWSGRGPDDGRIDLNGSVFDAERLIRAVTRPYPGAFFEKDNHQYIVWKASLEPPAEPAELVLSFADGDLHCIDFEESGCLH